MSALELTSRSKPPSAPCTPTQSNDWPRGEASPDIMREVVKRRLQQHMHAPLAGTAQASNTRIEEA